MTILIHDHTALVEPNLLIPGKSPIGTVEIERNHVFSPTNFWLFNVLEPHDLVTKIKPTMTGAASFKSGKLHFSGVQDSNYLKTQNISTNGGTVFNFAFQIKFKTSESAAAIFQWSDVVGSGAPYLYIDIISNHVRVYFDGGYIYNGSVDVRNEETSVTVTDNVSTRFEVYVNSTQVYGAFPGLPRSNSNSGDAFWINNGYADSGAKDVTYSHLTYWTGINYIPAHTIPTIAYDPYQFLRAVG